jgi:hypothetical protein
VYYKSSTRIKIKKKLTNLKWSWLKIKKKNV